MLETHARGGCLLNVFAGPLSCIRHGTWWSYRLSVSHDFFDDVTFEEGEAFVTAKVPVGEFVLIEAKLMKHRRVDVAEVVR